MKWNEKTKGYVGTALTFLAFLAVLMCDTSFVMLKRTDGIVRILLFFASAAVLLVIKRPKLALRQIVILSSLLFMPAIWFFFSFDVKQTLIIFVAVTVGWIVSQTLGRREFCDLMSRVITVFSALSLIAIFIYWVAPGFVTLFPVVEENRFFITYNMFIGVITETGYAVRNYGVFGEPGLFAVFISIAIWIELYRNDKPNIWRLALYVLTMLTTMSTMGFVCAGILAFGVFFRKETPKKIKISLASIFVLGIAAVLIYEPGLFSALFEKFLVMNESVSIRTAAITEIGKLFLSSPVYGVGISSFIAYSAEHVSSLASFTYFNLLAMHGIIGGLIPIVGIFSFFMKRSSRWLLRLVLFAFTLALFSSQACEQMPIFYAMVFYGLDDIVPKKWFSKKGALNE